MAKLKGSLPGEAYDIASGSIKAHMELLPIHLGEISGTLIKTANRAFVDGMTESMLIGAGILVVTSLLVLIMLPAVVRRSEDMEGHEARDTTMKPKPHAAPSLRVTSPIFS